jgi:hypothetical protein
MRRRGKISVFAVSLAAGQRFRVSVPLTEGQRFRVFRG